MKTTIFAVVIVLLTVTMLTNCQMTNKKLEALKKVQDAKDAEIKAIQALNLATNDSIQLIKKELEEKAVTYQKNLADYKSMTRKDQLESKIITEKKVSELEQKNEEMINRLSNFQDTTEKKGNFELFRYELGREMNELSKSLKSLNS